MSNLSPRSSRPPSRRSRERSAYRLVVVGGTAALVAIIGVVLAIAGVIGMLLPLLAVIVAVVCTVLFRRTVSR